MNEILKSPLFEKLKRGELPVIEVSVSSETLAYLAIAIFLAVVAALIAQKILSRY